MDLVLGTGHSSDIPKKSSLKMNEKSDTVVRRSANYVPEIWGDRFAKLPQVPSYAQNVGRANELKDQVRILLQECTKDDNIQGLNLINNVQRLGVAYHFEKEIAEILDGMHRAHKLDGHCNNYCDADLHIVALRFRLLRQGGYNESPNVFNSFKDQNGAFKKALLGDIRGLLSLYEAAHMGAPGEDILDEAIDFTKEQLTLTLPHLGHHKPLKTLVELALDMPLRKRIERLQTRYYISIYEEDDQEEDASSKSILLEFAKLDFNILQSMYHEELREITAWWKRWNFGGKLPFIRDRVVECYFWILGVYFEPQYTRGRRMMTKIISLTSIMDDIYDVYATIQELGPYTKAIQRWDRSAIDEMPDFMKLHLNALMDVINHFEEELAQEGKSFRIPYFKNEFALLSKCYLVEEWWRNSNYVPGVEEYVENGLITSAYPMLTLVSYLGMGDEVTKEVCEWASNKKSMPKMIEAASKVSRFLDDITSNELEQEREHVASLIQILMEEKKETYEDTCNHVKKFVVDAWKVMNGECKRLKDNIPMSVLMRTMNLARVIEVLYQHRDGYTDPTHETKDRINLVLLDGIPL